jgi:hypothetical protein
LKIQPQIASVEMGENGWNSSYFSGDKAKADTLSVDQIAYGTDHVKPFSAII